MNSLRSVALVVGIFSFCRSALPLEDPEWEKIVPHIDGLDASSSAGPCYMFSGWIDKFVPADCITAVPSAELAWFERGEGITVHTHKGWIVVSCPDRYSYVAKSGEVGDPYRYVTAWLSNLGWGIKDKLEKEMHAENKEKCGKLDLFEIAKRQGCCV